MYDAIIVGFGLSGVAVAKHFESLNKRILIIDNNVSKASEVAAGIYNPITLKRFTLAWEAHEQLKYAKEFYSSLEKELNCNFDNALSIYRRFNSVEEQNNWFTKSTSPVFEKYIDPILKESITDAVSAPFKYGKLNNTGRINIKKLIQEYKKKLRKTNKYIEEKFDYEAIKFEEDSVSYNNTKAKRIIFCEGYGLKQNPFFNYLPLVGSKGSYLIIESPQLKLTVALKAHFYLIPVGSNQYKFGATYEHLFKGKDHDASAKEYLIDQLNKLIEVPYKILNHETGTRPTVSDRRPLIGKHPEYEKLIVFNGMGSRGILIAPTMAKELVNSLFNEEDLPIDVDIKRFVST